MLRPLAILLAALACSPARADVVFGLPLPRTGAATEIGEQVLRGAAAAVRAINAGGGIRGEPIALDVQDDACDPKQAVAVAENYVRRGVRLVVGHVCSGASIVASDVYAEAGAVMISPSSTAARLTDRNLSAVFRVCWRDDDQGRLSAAIIAERFRDRKVAILHDGTPVARGLADATKANLNKIGTVEALLLQVAPNERDYAPVIARLKAAQIEVAYYGGEAAAMGLLVRQSDEQGFKPQWFGTSSIATPDYAKAAGGAADGTLMTLPPDPRRRPEAAEAVAAFKAEGSDARGFTLYGYAAVQAMAKAAAIAGSAEPRAVERALRSERFDLVIGKVGFDQKGDVTAPGYVLYVWKNGSYTYAD
jgi:branched-chain amino acid transport system substrate-binding protein